jgi:hypothetical protein
MTSVNQLRVYDVLAAAQRWLPATQIAVRAGGIHARTAHNMAKQLVAAGLVEEARMFPATHFRVRAIPSPEGKQHLAELDRIRSVVNE